MEGAGRGGGGVEGERREKKEEKKRREMIRGTVPIIILVCQVKK